ncbi:polyprenyl synthetase family protein [Streptomyces sp. NBC_01795]|uniref:polyprenyl synthetase family protein n=1 Tax=unclassified Streptomyces TaxID=2593676 RepID=UPI002DDB48DE|nr:MULTISPECIES: polyprenyl synthetase family protein [unclassified Streptomyces]WSA91257.1 polyprenyl synthetase family protein [Streptomyces sp. NBC_01795]WSB75580.1 polyprenyl synthetase family protein [Streptomyces sp. NBC_01775]
MRLTRAGGPEPPLAELRDAVEEGVERWLAASGDVRLEDVHRWALLPSGKLLRPLLLLTSTGVVGGRYEQVLPVAVGVELAHVASLVHDDIIDNDDLRRGRASVRHRFGTAHAILGADSLFFALFQQLGECRRRGVPNRAVVEVMELLARAGREAASGVVLEMALSGRPATPTAADGNDGQAPGRGDGQVAGADDGQAAGGDGDGQVAAYVEMVRLKSASLLRAACHAGAVLGGATRAQAEVLSQYGQALGIAFQIRDDLLPYRRGPRQTDKPPESDLRNQRPALPLLLAHRMGTPADRTLLAALADEYDGAAEGEAGEERARHERVRRLVEETGALQEAHRMAQEHVDACHRALAALPSGRDRDLLASLAEQLAAEGDAGSDMGSSPAARTGVRAKTPLS